MPYELPKSATALGEPEEKRDSLYQLPKSAVQQSPGTFDEQTAQLEAALEGKEVGEYQPAKPRAVGALDQLIAGVLEATATTPSTVSNMLKTQIEKAQHAATPTIPINWIPGPVPGMGIPVPDSSPAASEIGLSELLKKTEKDEKTVKALGLIAGANLATVSQYPYVRDEPTGMVDKAMRTIGSGGVSLAEAAGLTFLAGGNPAPAALFFGAMAESDTYQRALKEGTRPEDAESLGELRGVAEGALEYIGLKWLLARHGGPIRTFIARLLEEPVQEALQSGAQHAIEVPTIAPERTSAEIKEDIAYSAFAGLVLGGGASSVMSMLDETHPDVDRETKKKIVDGIAPIAEAAEKEFAEVPEAPQGPVAAPVAEVAPGSLKLPQSAVEVPESQIETATAEPQVAPGATEALEATTEAKKPSEAIVPPAEAAEVVEKGLLKQKQMDRARELVAKRLAKVDKYGEAFVPAKVSVRLPKAKAVKISTRKILRELGAREVSARKNKWVPSETKEGKGFKMEPAEKLASTSGQMAEVHRVASEKALLDPKTGKTRPGYRRLAEMMVGKTSASQMTRKEAEIFLGALNRLPKPKMGKKGQLVPPSIPKTTALVRTGEFEREFKEPRAIEESLTPQTYYSSILGTRYLTKPLEEAKQRFDLEYREASNQVDKMLRKIERLGRTSFTEKAKAKLTNRPTAAIERMRDLLDKHETAPEELSPKEKEVFDWFRNLNREILKRENAVRRAMEMSEIKERKAYVRHTADMMAKEMLEGRYPFPQNLKYWASQRVVDKIHNPMEMQRKLSDDLAGIFTKDLGLATKSMLWTGLKEVHLTKPLKFFSEQFGAVSKDIATYENLTPREQEQAEKQAVLPASTKKWLIDFVNVQIKGQETDFDEKVNNWFTKGVGYNLINKILRPFGRSLSRKPVTNFMKAIGRSTISGVMGWRPKQLIRNKFQGVQNLALYTLKANLKGFLPKTKAMKELLTDNLFRETYTGFEELPQGMQKKLESVWLAPYQLTATTNVTRAMKVAYWDTLDLITKKKYKDLGWADPKRTYTEAKEFLYPSEKKKILAEMELGADVTQFHYIPMGMPGIFKHKTLTPLTRLQSWWMNYFTKFHREAIHRGITGETRNKLRLPWSRRIGWLRYMILGGFILNMLGYYRSYLFGVAPSALAPPAQFVLGLYMYLVAQSEWQRAQAKKKMIEALKVMIPGYLAVKDWNAIIRGEKPLSHLFFYSKWKKKKPTRKKNFRFPLDRPKRMSRL